MDDVSFVMIDGNNDAMMGGSMKGGGGGVLNTENSRIGRRQSSEYGAGIPLPAVLKAHQELLMLIAAGET